METFTIEWEEKSRVALETKATSAQQAYEMWLKAEYDYKDVEIIESEQVPNTSVTVWCDGEQWNARYRPWEGGLPTELEKI